MTKYQKRNDPKPQPIISPLIIGIVVVIAVIFVGGLVAIGFFSTPAAESVDLDGFPATGKAEAKVTMVEYSDYG